MPLRRQDIQDQIDTLLNDNSNRDITPLRLRTVLTSIVNNLALATEVPQPSMSLILLNSLATVNEIALTALPVETFVLLSNPSRDICNVVFAGRPTINGLTVIDPIAVMPHSALLVYVVAVNDIKMHALVAVDFPA
jgi:hypothetical protein